MKINYCISNVNHEDLVNILETATYGSDWLELDIASDELSTKLYNESKHRCYSEKLADVLLGGGKIVGIDHEDDCKEYKFDLKKAKRRINKFLQKYPHNAKEIIEDDGDYFTYNNMVQFIMFGDVIYG